MAQSQPTDSTTTTGTEYLPKALAVVGSVSIVVGLVTAFFTGQLISFVGFGLVELFFIAGGALFISVSLLSSRPENPMYRWVLYALLAIVVLVALFVLFVLEIA